LDNLPVFPKYRVLSVHITQNERLVNAVTIPLQNNGLPIAPVIIGFLLIIEGFIYRREAE